MHLLLAAGFMLYFFHVPLKAIPIPEVVTVKSTLAPAIVPKLAVNVSKLNINSTIHPQ